MIVQILVSMAATIAFAVLFHVPRSEYLLCGINGAIGWMVYLFCISKGTGGTIASMWACLLYTSDAAGQRWCLPWWQGFYLQSVKCPARCS